MYTESSETSNIAVSPKRSTHKILPLNGVLNNYIMYSCARDPTVTDTRDPTVTDTRDPTVTDIRYPTVTDTRDPRVTDTMNPTITDMCVYVQPSTGILNMATV